MTQETSEVQIWTIIDNLIRKAGQREYLSLRDKVRLRQEVFNSIRKLDILQEYLEDESVTEIMINSERRIFVERAGKIEETNASFSSKEKYEDVIQQIVAKSNRIVNESNPIVDTRLEDGSRVNVVLSPIAIDGSAVTIRKFPKKVYTMEDLIRFGSLSRGIARILEVLVKSRYNIFISGGTGSGKTTFLNALSQYIPSDERIITIEDSAELKITTIPNMIRLEMRNANLEGGGAITISQLLKTSLRMRPDRIIIGETRGEEALDMLQAMNTGHDGSISTGHGNSCKEMLMRLETMVLMGADMPLLAIRQQIASALDIMIHLGRMKDRSRRVLEITEVSGCENGMITLNPLFRFVESDQTGLQFCNPLQFTQKLDHSGYRTEYEEVLKAFVVDTAKQTKVDLDDTARRSDSGSSLAVL
ncbi:MAG: CpaF family protein [Lachnospiraceae bacterium]